MAVDMEPYYPLKEGEEAHWEVGHMTRMWQSALLSLSPGC